MPRFSILALTLALAVAGLSSCATGSTSAPLDGRTFESTSVTGHTLVAGTSITLRFEGGSVGADAGCNHIGGAYSLDGDVLRITELSMTEMACEPATKMDQDQWLATLLTSGPTTTLDGPTLTLASGATRIVLAEQITVDQPLEGTRWELQSIVTGTGPSATVEDATLPTAPATLTIDNGQVAFSGGVNVGSGPAAVTGDTITFGHLMVSLRPLQNDRRGHIETAVLGVIQGTVTYAIDGDTLTVTAEDGEHGLVYRAVANPAGGQ